MQTISIVGAGVIGTATGKGFKELGNDVYFYDISKKRLSTLDNEGFNTGSSLVEVMSKSTITFVCVNTPTTDDGIQDLSQILSASSAVIRSLEEVSGFHLIVFRSTILPGTMRNRIVRIFKDSCSLELGKDYDICYNPEFLRERYADIDFLNPDRVVIGEDFQREGSSYLLKQLYKPLTDNIITTNYETAEMIKYASNCFLSLKISYFNQIGDICERIGIDPTIVSKGVMNDKRIGKYGTVCGKPFDGACLPKDTKAFNTYIENIGNESNLLKVALDINQRLKNRIPDMQKEIRHSV